MRCLQQHRRLAVKLFITFHCAEKLARLDSVDGFQDQSWCHFSLPLQPLSAVPLDANYGAQESARIRSRNAFWQAGAQSEDFPGRPWLGAQNLTLLCSAQLRLAQLRSE